MKITLPTWKYEEKYLAHSDLIIGIDEVGRGALAGPVYSAAFAIDPSSYIRISKAFKGLGICDSKMLSAAKREKLATKIKKINRFFAVGLTPAADINKVGIVKATYLAMNSAINKLLTMFTKVNHCSILVDGLAIKPLSTGCETIQEAIIKGDNKCMTIACASIIAKVARDKHMTDLADGYSSYGWNRNKGYGTTFHRQQIALRGPSNEHRELFIRNINRAL